MVNHSRGSFDHVLYATSLPVFLGHGMHHLEAFDEAVADGAWGAWAARRLGEPLRQGMDLEHWPAFGTSFARLEDLLEEVASGHDGDQAPGSVVLLSGDVHHAYLARVRFPQSPGVAAPVYQAVCSPLRNPLDSHERRAIKFAIGRVGSALARGLARLAGVRPPRTTWEIDDGPWFDNQVAGLVLDRRRARMTLDKAVAGDGGPDLERVFEKSLTP